MLQSNITKRVREKFQTKSVILIDRKAFIDEVTREYFSELQASGQVPLKFESLFIEMIGFYAEKATRVITYGSHPMSNLTVNWGFKS